MTKKIDLQQYLHDAKVGLVASVRDAIVNQKINVDDVLDEPYMGYPAGTTALMIAAHKAHSGVVKCLFEFYADIKKCNSVGNDAFTLTLLSDAVDENAGVALDEIANLILDKASQHRQKKMILLGEANLTETPALIYAIEQNMSRTALRLVRLGIPYEVVFDLDSHHQSPNPDLHPRFSFTDGCNAFEMAIAKNNLHLVQVFINGCYYENSSLKPNSARITCERITLGNPMEVTLEHLQIAVQNGASFETFWVIFGRLETLQKRQINLLDIILFYVKCKQKFITAQDQEVFLPRSCDSETARQLLHLIPEHVLLGVNPLGRSIVFEALRGMPWFLDMVIQKLQKLVLGDRNFAAEPDNTDITPIEYAVNIGSLQAIPVLMKYGATLDKITARDLAYAEYAFRYVNPNLDQPVAMQGSILQFAALNNHVALLSALLALPAEKYDPVVAKRQALVVLPILRAAATEYADVLFMLEQASLTIDEQAAVSDQLTSGHRSSIAEVDIEQETVAVAETGAPPLPKSSKHRRHASVPLLWGFVGGCFGAPAPAPAASATSTPGPTPVATRSNTPITGEPPTSPTPPTPVRSVTPSKLWFLLRPSAVSSPSTVSSPGSIIVGARSSDYASVGATLTLI